MTRLLLSLAAFLVATACTNTPFAVPGSPVALVRVTAQCEAAYGHRIYDALAVASDYWHERGKPRLLVTDLVIGVPIRCPKELRDGVWGLSSRHLVEIRDSPKATDVTPCKFPLVNLARIVTHEIGHMHGVSHDDSSLDNVMASVAAMKCEAP